MAERLVWVQSTAPNSVAFKVKVHEGADIEDLKDAVVAKQSQRNASEYGRGVLHIHRQRDDSQSSIVEDAPVEFPISGNSVSVNTVIGSTRANPYYFVEPRNQGEGSTQPQNQYITRAEARAEAVAIVAESACLPFSWFRSSPVTPVAIPIGTLQAEQVYAPPSRARRYAIEFNELLRRSHQNVNYFCHFRRRQGFKLYRESTTSLGYAQLVFTIPTLDKTKMRDAYLVFKALGGIVGHFLHYLEEFDGVVPETGLPESPEDESRSLNQTMVNLHGQYYEPV